METLVESLKNRPWAVVSGRKVLQTFEDLDVAWKVVETLRGNFTVLSSVQILEEMRIKDKEDYNNAVKRLEEIFHTQEEDELNELENLAEMISDYEDIHYPFPPRV